MQCITNVAKMQKKYNKVNDVIKIKPYTIAEINNDV